MANIPKFIPSDATPEELAALGVPPSPAPANLPPAQAPTVEPATTPPAAADLNTAQGAQPAVEPTTAEPVMGDTVTGDGSGTALPPFGQSELISPEEQTAEERAEVARMAHTVTLAFPPIGFIDVEAELEKMLRITQTMAPDIKAAYPDKVRAAILAHEAGKGPEVSDEELALAIFIQRTTATPLTEEELEAKATGRKKRDPSAPPKAKKNQTKAEKSIDQLKALGF